MFQTGRKTVGKREIARNQQFLLFPQCFQKTCTADMLKQGLVWESVNSCGKGENAGYQHFLLFQQTFQKASPIGSLKVRIKDHLQNTNCRDQQYNTCLMHHKLHDSCTSVVIFLTSFITANQVGLCDKHNNISHHEHLSLLSKTKAKHK